MLMYSDCKYETKNVFRNEKLIFPYFLYFQVKSHFDAILKDVTADLLTQATEKNTAMFIHRINRITAR